ncbi:MAG: AMP-binding protein [Thermodesulfobacteriota bacterium]|nr:AMP-binding protein [Thermodesulfobacteriota bacterium]
MSEKQLLSEEKPWLKFYGDIPKTVDYPKLSMYEAVMETVHEKPDYKAYDFMGREATYTEFAGQIDQCADALWSIGLRKGDCITISMPTSPPGVIAFYAANKLGAVASMIHPLSTESEIEFYVNVSKSKFVLTLDIFYDKMKAVQKKTQLEKLIIAKIQDWLPPHLSFLYWLKKGRMVEKVPASNTVIIMKDLMKKHYPKAPVVKVDTHDMAVILYSGGTTGKPKGIMLSNYNFISEGLMVANWGGIDERYPNMLAVLPIFHGFGLGVCVNAILMAGGKCIMIPMFNPDEIGGIIKKKKPNYLIGPPTLYSALARSKSFRQTDLSCLRATFSGADTLPEKVKDEFENVVRQNKGNTKLLEGYGLTEAVTAIMATPINDYRKGSIGLPFPDMLAKIVEMDTINEIAPGQEGEICVSGPAVMMGYLDNPEETAKVLKKHADGRTWLHTGDIGYMDKDGFFYFSLRKKRMIKSSGMNVYPAQVEEELYKHPLVKDACVIGVPDEKQVERVKAFVVLNDTDKAGAEMEKELISYCRKNIIKWSCPREVEFRADLPQTLVGKIAYKKLEDEEISRLKAEGKFAGKN